MIQKTIQSLLLVLAMSICFESRAQDNHFFVSAGYGLAGSFFVRSYTEFSPSPGAKTFFKKRFLGVSQDAAVGINLKKNWEIRAGINYQHFTRRIETIDTLRNSFIVSLNHDIHHRNYMWFASTAKQLMHKNHSLGLGLGLYYLLPKQEEVEITSAYFENFERDQKHNGLNELGTFAEFSYEYKFQPRVNIGVKTQFYYTITAAYAESVTLFPYVKILF